MRWATCLLLAASLAPAQDWVIQDRTLSITRPTTHAGTIAILAGGVLDIGADFTQAGLVAVFGGGLLRVHDCRFRFSSTYNGQYAIIAVETGRFEIARVQYSAGGWQSGLIAADDASADIRDSSFLLEPSGVVQPAMYGRGTITMEDCLGLFEVILMDQGRFAASRIPPAAEDPPLTLLWVWPVFGQGDQAVLTYPPPGVQDFSFPGPEDHTGFAYALASVNIPFWPMLVRPGCDVTVQDNAADRGLIVGLMLYESAVLSLTNGACPADFTVPLADRSFRVLRSTIRTWNLYPYDGVTLVVEDSVIGELLGQGNSVSWVLNSTIDGSGGFLGAAGTAHVTLVDSAVTTMVQSVENGSLDFIRSRLLPHPSGVPSYLTMAGEGRAWLMDTEAPQLLVLNGDHCLPLTSIVPGEGDIAVTFDRRCPAGGQEKFADVTVSVEDPGRTLFAMLYAAALQPQGEVRAALPAWCLPPCVCGVVLDFSFGGEAREYRRTLCDDETHARPVRRP